jgi:hypothetical protein
MALCFGFSRRREGMGHNGAAGQRQAAVTSLPQSKGGRQGRVG